MKGTGEADRQGILNFITGFVGHADASESR